LKNNRFILVVKLIGESFIVAIQSLKSNKLRTLLSLLGITIGIFAIITVFSLVDSLERNIRGSIEQLGDNVVFIQKWPWEFGGDYPWWKYWQRPQPSLHELKLIQKKSTLAAATVYQIDYAFTAKYKSTSIENVISVGVSHQFNLLKEFSLDEGRYFSLSESNSGLPVAIIGKAVALSLFGLSSPIGQKIKLGGKNVTVIGVFQKEGESVLGNSLDGQIVTPAIFLKTMVDTKQRGVNQSIWVKAKPGVKNEDLMYELRGIMRSIRKIKPLADDNFALNETSMLTTGFSDMFAMITIIGAIIGGFSILVGGFSVANIMYVSVKERTSIIGIQKALGAKNYFILLQFLFEAIFLSMIGGLMGLLLVWLVTKAASAVIDMEVILSWTNIVTGLTISFIIGIISGVFPSRMAAKMNPVVAIRSNG
jgi:putative ABC transport system permease protein